MPIVCAYHSKHSMHINIVQLLGNNAQTMHMCIVFDKTIHIPQRYIVCALFGGNVHCITCNVLENNAQNNAHDNAPNVHCVF